MPTRRALVAFVLVAAIAGCGGQQSHSQRTAVAAYVKTVNRIEVDLARPLRTVTVTSGKFAQEERSGGSLTNLVYAANELALLKAAREIEAQRIRLTSLHTPVTARRLRSLLLRIMDGEVGLTHEIARLVVFLPHFNAALVPLAPATRRLDAALTQRSATGQTSVTVAYATKAAALRAFQSELDRILTQLRKLDPPAVSRPQYDGQVHALRGMSLAAGRLATALQSGTQGDVQQSLRDFDRAATSNQTAAADKAQIAAVRAYDEQSVHLAKLTAAAEEERLRLAETLP
jgi:hypothetical protein